jgi:hypothetical protein
MIFNLFLYFASCFNLRSNLFILNFLNDNNCNYNKELMKTNAIDINRLLVTKFDLPLFITFLYFFLKRCFLFFFAIMFISWSSLIS